jgi:[acyl-carrier-protein] S-malonyltransferase
MQQRSEMGKLVFVFPGQGSQYVGMGVDCYRNSDVARRLFDEADRILGYSLTSVCFEGPEDELRQTRNTQPGIFLHSMVVAAMLQNTLRPDMTAGHSLGEYTALAVAGAITFEDALRLVRLRGELMQKAGEKHTGTMAAVVGMRPEQVEELCRHASIAGVVQPANFNSPGQIVISGSIAGVHTAMELARQQGAKLVKELVVSGAFHSPLMADAKEGLKRALDETPIRDASVPVYANVTAEPATTKAEIRDMLYRQMTSPVQWERTMKNMARDGATTFIEVGPGKVLQGLVKRTNPSAEIKGYDTYADVHEITVQGVNHGQS